MIQPFISVTKLSLANITVYKGNVGKGCLFSYLYSCIYAYFEPMPMGSTSVIAVGIIS